MLPSAAAATARRMAAVKASGRATAWSAGATTRMGSAPSAAASQACSAASVSAGAVLRPVGSRRMAPGLQSISRSWSSTMKRCSSLPTMQGAATSTSSPARASRRRVDCWNSVPSPASARNCLGYSARLSGHRRVPLPPAMMTGRTVWRVEVLIECSGASRAEPPEGAAPCARAGSAGAGKPSPERAQCGSDGRETSLRGWSWLKGYRRRLPEVKPLSGAPIGH